MASMSDSDYERYQAMVKKLADELGNTFKVAELAGVGNSALYRQMRGENKPSPAFVEAIEEAYTVVFEEEYEHKVSSWSPPPQYPATNNGTRSVLDLLADASAKLDETREHLTAAKLSYGEFVGIMGLAYDNSNPLVARGIRSAIDEMVETRKLLEGVK